MKEIHLDHIDVTESSINGVKPFKSTIFDENGMIKLVGEMQNLLRLVQKKPPYTEIAVSYDLKLNRLTTIEGKDGDASVKMPKEDMLYIIMHNHPTGSTLTHIDIESFAKNPNAVMVIAVGNNGKVYAVEKGFDFDEGRFKDYLKDMKKKHKGYARSADNYEKFIMELIGGLEDYGLFTFGY